MDLAYFKRSWPGFGPFLGVWDRIWLISRSPGLDLAHFKRFGPRFGPRDWIWLISRGLGLDLAQYLDMQD